MKPAKVFLAILFVLTTPLMGCAGQKGSEGFAIYLLKEDVLPTQLPALSHVDVEGGPLIATSDVVTYQDHILTLTPAAFQRVARLKVPVRGLSFAVCVDRAVIYTGAFWTPISSISYDGVVIMQPLPSIEGNTIMISLGYPASSFLNPNLTDPRGDARVVEALRAAGKLH
jgi:hypothetical protein